MDGKNSDRLADYIAYNGLTLQEVGDKLSVTPGTVYNWINGKHKVSRRHQRAIEELLSDQQTDDWLEEAVKGTNMTKDEAKEIINFLGKEKNKLTYLELLVRIEREKEND